MKLIIFIFIIFYSNLTNSQNVNEEAISELDCLSQSKCIIKKVEKNDIAFSSNDKTGLKCWAIKPIYDLYTYEMHFSVAIENKDMTLNATYLSDQNNEVFVEKHDMNLGGLVHLFNNKHKAFNVMDSGMSFDLKFNYPNILYDQNEIVETELTFVDGTKVNLEMTCLASPFIVSMFQNEIQQNSSIQTPTLSNYLDAKDLNIEKYSFKALIIGIDEYENSIGSLDTPVNDAIALDDILKNNYNFKTKLLLNPSRSEIYEAMDYFSKNLKPSDNFLIYFAGHGEIDVMDKDNSYWLPSDSKKNSKSNWISNVVITQWVKSLKSKHVLVIADSCYAGALSRGSIGNFNKSNAKAYFQRLIDKKSRKILASGGEEPVLDGGGGNHSIFAKALIDVLQENEVLMETYSLFDQIRKKVIVNSPQTPEYEIIFAAGDDGGEFVFLPKY